MKIRDIMTTQVSTATPDTTLEEIATIMKDEDVGAVPIVDDDELTGIITDRDIVIRCVAEGQDPSEVAAEEIATEDIESISPDDDVRRAADIMGRHQIRRLPVVDDGRLVGMVSLGDIAVKDRGRDDESAEALEEISRGVKQNNRRGGNNKQQPQRAASIRGSRQVGTAPETNDKADRVSRLHSQGLREHRDSGTTGRSSSTPQRARNSAAPRASVSAERSGSDARQQRRNSNSRRKAS